MISSRRLLVVASVWLLVALAASAALALVIADWRDAAGVSRGSLIESLNAERQSHAMKADLVALTNELDDKNNRLDATVGRILLIFAARGISLPEAIRAGYFPETSQSDFDLCMLFLRSSTETPFEGNIALAFRACDKAAANVQFPAAGPKTP